MRFSIALSLASVFIQLFALFTGALFFFACEKAPAPGSPETINAVAFSRGPQIIGEQPFWWHDPDGDGSATAQSDTIRLLANAQYGTSVGFYHIGSGDTLNLNYELLQPAHQPLLLWTPSSPAFSISFKSGSVSGLGAYIETTDQRGIYSLGLELRQNADYSQPNNPGGEVLVKLVYPVVIE